MGDHSHFSVEEIAACEIEEGKGVLFCGIVFEVYPMVDCVFEEAYSHIVDRLSSVIVLRVRYMVCDEGPLL